MEQDGSHAEGVVAVEAGWEGEGDEALLALCHGERRALLTNNVADFAVIVRTWAAQGRFHHGVVFTSDASIPRHRNTIGRYVELLDQLMSAHPADDALADGVRWLSAERSWSESHPW